MLEEHGAPESWDDIAEWFRERGFGVQVSPELEDVAWVDLTSLTSGRIVAPKYGRGTTALDAARSAKRRFSIEQ